MQRPQGIGGRCGNFVAIAKVLAQSGGRSLGGRLGIPERGRQLPLESTLPARFELFGDFIDAVAPTMSHELTRGLGPKIVSTAGTQRADELGDAVLAFTPPERL